MHIDKALELLNKMLETDRIAISELILMNHVDCNDAFAKLPETMCRPCDNGGYSTSPLGVFGCLVEGGVVAYVIDSDEENIIQRFIKWEEEK